MPVLCFACYGKLAREKHGTHDESRHTRNFRRLMADPQL